MSDKEYPENDATAVDARKWANEWLGELVRYIEVGA